MGLTTSRGNYSIHSKGVFITINKRNNLLRNQATSSFLFLFLFFFFFFFFLELPSTTPHKADTSTKVNGNTDFLSINI